MEGMAGVKIFPVLFNTVMTRAILDGRKTETRRALKPQPLSGAGGMWQWKDCQWMDGGLGFPKSGIKDYAPYQPGDILWVRETWAYNRDMWLYKADYPASEDFSWAKWHPSIHMPREAARIFLQVKKIEVQRLQEMVLADVLLEGIKEADDYYETWDRWHSTWNSTITQRDRDKYGWEVNPWVWVIRFERCEKPEG